MKVFLGSTSDDLIDVRAELRDFIPSLDFELICFENLEFKKPPKKNTHDACLHNVPDCDIYVLIINENFGTEYDGENANPDGKSLTWAEVEVALNENKIICTFVRKVIWLEKATYAYNKKQGIEIISYYAKDKRVFDFIEYIATRGQDNWIDQFNDIVDLKRLIESRLKYIDSMQT